MRDSARRRKATSAQTIKEKMVARNCGKRGFQKKWQLALCLVLTMISFCYYHHMPSDSFDLASLSAAEKAELRRQEPSVIANLTAGSPHRLGRFCDSGNDCFSVEQRYWFQNGLKAQRMIMYDLNRMMALTMANLKTPEIITSHDLVHERWRVDHGRLMFSYNLMQIAAGFMLEGLSFNRSSGLPAQRVLQIGMGGGSATGYMAEMPLPLHIDVVELEANVYAAAKQWFDFPESPTIKVHIMDGVVFAKEAAERGETFDSVILDASSNTPNASIVCPHEVFLQEDVMAAMSQVTRQFAAHFKSCFALKILVNGQKFLVCSNREGFDWARQRERMLANLAVFDAVMGTNVAPYLDHLNPVPIDL